jgi:glycosyltransferase involved in cell wall biosynthesis
VIKVLNVNSSLDSKTGGGTAERTFQMSRFLARRGLKCTVLTIDTGLDDARVFSLQPANIVAIPLLFRRFYVPKVSWKTISDLVKQADIVHLMGHWGILNALVYFAVRRAGKPYVVCPAGALPLFGRSGWLKRLYNAIVGRAIIRNASAWIAVTSSELPQFEAYGIPASQIKVISNGVCEDDFSEFDVPIFLQKNRIPDVPIILFMGRLNLIKGPDLLLQAFFSLKDKIPSYHLVFAGPDGGMLSSLVEMTANMDLGDRVHFVGFIAGREKVACYHAANLLVVPSRQEAMSIVALEAGICGVPALLTDQCGFSEVNIVDQSLESTATVSGLANAILQLVSNHENLKLLGSKFRDLVLSRYTWDSKVSEYMHLYQKILKTAVLK